MVDASGQRSMATYLGAATHLTIDDVTVAGVLDRRDWLFLEAYLLDSPNGLALVQHLLDAYQGPIALTLSDPRCVERHHAFLTSALARLSLLIGNEKELEALVGGTSPTDSLSLLPSLPLAVCTNGGNGIFYRDGETLGHVPAVKTQVLDTTGAGDSFAGALLFGLCSGYSTQEACALGAKVAAHIVSVSGAKPLIDLKTLL
jgi:sugar/nucleoside kinase (ribokinase family)